MPVRRKKYEFKIYINHENAKTWEVINWCENEGIGVSDFFCKTVIAKYEGLMTKKTEKINDSIIANPPKQEISRVIDEEAEETDRMLASGEWEIVEDE